MNIDIDTLRNTLGDLMLANIQLASQLKQAEQKAEVQQPKSPIEKT